MRPQLFLADTVGRLNVPPPVRRSNRNDKVPGVEFDAFLNRAESVRETSRRRTSRSRRDRENEPPAQEQVAAAEQPAETNPQQPVNSTDSGGPTAAPASGQPPNPSPQTPQPTDQEAKAAQVAEGQPQRLQAPVEQAAQQVMWQSGASVQAGDGAEPPSKVVSVETEGLEWDPKLAPQVRTTTAPADQPSDPRQITGQGGDRSDVPTGRNEDGIPVNAPAASDASDQRRPAAPASEPVPVLPRSPRRQGPAARAGGEESAARTEGGHHVDRGSVHQHKPEVWTEEGGDGSSDGPTESDEPAGRPGNRAASVRAGERPRSLPQRLEVGEEAHPTGARAVAGDTTAAGVAEFLVGSSIGPDAADSQQSQSMVEHNAVRSGTPAVAASLVNRHAAGGVSPVIIAGSGLGADGVGAAGGGGLEGTAKVLKACGGEGRFHVVVQIEPPELGQLRLDIRMQHQTMVLQVDADTQAVARLIESRLSNLRETLTSHGIRMDRSDVVVRSPTTPEGNQAGQDRGQSGGNGPGHGGAEDSGGRQWEGGLAGGSQEQSAAWDGTPQPEGSNVAVDIEATVAEQGPMGFQMTPTTELSLDLVA
jgi:flagellar hook-length control protein FliK